ncbi:hypothetical protein DM02DRAFT_379861 [Periconia macrospinosa]|uniref:Uncharacterized protein n=1 Tax=Periconia macrospinosa TaxID=97972 RepID=A0A2V1E9X3_9PLEO|nr:hypothetical protein DM02DRAFT_379861 [Periconia macrospinosa]
MSFVEMSAHVCTLLPTSLSRGNGDHQQIPEEHWICEENMQSLNDCWKSHAALPGHASNSYSLHYVQWGDKKKE